MSATNNAFFIGRLGADAQLKADKFVTFSIAVKDPWKNPDGTERTNWFKMVFRGERAEKCLPYLTKGKLAAFSCVAETNRWVDKNGTERADVQFAVTDVEFMPGQTGRASAGGERPENAARPNNSMRPEVDQGVPLYQDLPF